MVLLTVVVAALFAFTACGENNTLEPIVVNQTETTAQEEQATLADSVLEEDDILHRLRADENFGWIASLINEWEEILGVTANEIFDHVRSQSSLDYAFENDFSVIDIGEWAQVESFPNEFMSMIQTAYFASRSVDIVHRWAGELGMTAYELINYVFGGNDTVHLADALEVDWVEWQTVLAGVANFIVH